MAGRRRTWGHNETVTLPWRDPGADREEPRPAPASAPIAPFKLAGSDIYAVCFL